MKRDDTIATILDTMTMTKRYMYASLLPATEAGGLSLAQLELLGTIRHLQPVPTKRLALQLHLTPGAISQLTDALEQAEFVERAADPVDRRVHTLRLTAKGEQKYQAIHKQRQALFRIVMQDMTDEELVGWLHVQQKIITSLKALSTAQSKQPKGENS